MRLHVEAVGRCTYPDFTAVWGQPQLVDEQLVRQEALPAVRNSSAPSA
jgi:hypothetical protein